MAVRRHAQSQQDDAARQFAAALSETLHGLRMKHRQVAEALGVTLATVDSWTRLTNPTIPGEKNLTTLCHWLDGVQPGAGSRLQVLVRPNMAAPQPGSAEGASASMAHLRAPPTSFVGRAQDLREVVRIFAETPTRMLTFIGPGGIGKTRLALQVSTELVANFEGGIWWVELAALRDGAWVWQALAAALDLRSSEPVAQSGKTLAEQVIARLHRASALVVFDNCEHVLTATSGVAARILRECPHVKLLATSRELLQLPEERAWPVPALTVPEADQKINRAQLNLFEAPRLFIERGFVQQRGFSLTEGNVPWVVEICQRLDGLPLAIELAAACLPRLSLMDIAHGLETRLSLLTGGSVFADARHQTLRAVISWSHDLLTPDERGLFAQVAVFAGGWTAEAAERVCGKTASPLALQRLVEKSLVFLDAHEGRIRYRMLETILEFAQESLTQRDDAPALRARHAAYYLDLAERGDLQTVQIDQLNALELELDNLRAALSWSQSHATDVYLRLCVALWPFWQVRGYLTEGRANMAWALDHSDDAPVALKAALWHGAGALARQQADRDATHQAFAHSLIYARQINQPLPLARVLNEMGLVFTAQQDSEQARGCYYESLDLCDRFDEGAASASIAAAALLGLGLMAFREGNYALAGQQLQTSLSAAVQAGDLLAELRALNGLGEIARAEGQWAQAKTYYARSVMLCRQASHKWALASALHNLGYAALHLDDGERAAAHFVESLRLFDALDEALGVAECVIGLGVVYAEQGDVDTAAQVLAAGRHFLQQAHAPLTELEQAEFDRAAVRVHAKFPGLLNTAAPLLFPPTVEHILALAERVR